jgi:hypothetical protein
VVVGAFSGRFSAQNVVSAKSGKADDLFPGLGRFVSVLDVGEASELRDEDCKLFLLPCFRGARKVCVEPFRGMVGCVASSPTVACRMSSQKVIKPSLKSAANFFPVRMNNSWSIAWSRRLIPRSIPGDSGPGCSLGETVSEETLLASELLGLSSGDISVEVVGCKESLLRSTFVASKDSFRVCREPEKTVRLLGLFACKSALRRSNAFWALTLASLVSMSSRATSGVAGASGELAAGASSNLFFLISSCLAHCFFNLLRSTSARWRSSRNSKTLRSCAARAVKKHPVVVVPVEFASRLVGKATGCSRKAVNCIGKWTEFRLRFVVDEKSAAADIVLLCD